MQKILLLSALSILFISINISAQTEANFYFDIPESPGKMVAPAEVEFIDASNGVNLDYNWTINGEDVSIEEDFNQTFKESGSYEICLQLIGEEGIDTMCQRLEFFDTDTRQEIISVCKE